MIRKRRIGKTGTGVRLGGEKETRRGQKEDRIAISTSSAGRKYRKRSKDRRKEGESRSKEAVIYKAQGSKQFLQREIIEKMTQGG